MTITTPAQMREAAALLPCPFCGGEAYLSEDASHSRAYFIGCNVDDCFGEIHWEQTKAEAIAAWNRRATPTVQEAAKVPEIAEALRLAGQFAIACRIARSSLGPHADTGHLEAIALRYIRWPDMTNLDAALRAIAGDSHE